MHNINEPAKQWHAQMDLSERHCLPNAQSIGEKSIKIWQLRINVDVCEIEFGESNLVWSQLRSERCGRSKTHFHYVIPVCDYLNHKNLFSFFRSIWKIALPIMNPSDRWSYASNKCATSFESEMKWGQVESIFHFFNIICARWLRGVAYLLNQRVQVQRRVNL